LWLTILLPTTQLQVLHLLDPKPNPNSLQRVIGGHEDSPHYANPPDNLDNIDYQMSKPFSCSQTHSLPSTIIQEVKIDNSTCLLTQEISTPSQENNQYTPSSSQDINQLPSCTTQDIDTNTPNINCNLNQETNSTTNASAQNNSSVAINIITNNINGLQIRSHPTRLNTLYRQMSNLDIDICMLQEINTNVNHHLFKSSLNATTTQHPGIQSVWSSAPGNRQTPYLPGGTSILVNNSISKHISQRICDSIGRWSGVVIKQKRKNPLLCLSLYQPPKQQNLQGTVNVTSQQTRWIQDQQLNTTIYKKFQEDLIHLIQNFQQTGHNIIIAGDVNEHDSESGLLHIMTQSLHLVDIFKFHNLTSSTYTRGPHMLDRIFTSPEIVPFISHLKVEDPDLLLQQF
jgi:exonuclease III